MSLLHLVFYNHYFLKFAIHAYLLYFFNVGNEQNENDLHLEIQGKINTHLLVMNWKGLKYIDYLIFVVTMCNIFI